jgi:hypothetical protein
MADKPNAKLQSNGASPLAAVQPPFPTFYRLLPPFKKAAASLQREIQSVPPLGAAFRRLAERTVVIRTV